MKMNEGVCPQERERAVTRCALGVSFVSLLAIASCEAKESPVYRRSGEPDLISIDADDTDMNLAMVKARESIDECLKRLDLPPDAQPYLALKVRLHERETVEHIWLNSVSHTGGLFAGLVGNDPVDLKKVKLVDCNH